MNTHDILLNATKTASNNPETKLLQMFEAERTVSALSSVINYIITDAFNLSSEESIWIGVLLNNALEPLKAIIPTATLGAVKQELHTGSYSLRLFERTSTPTNGITATEVIYDANVNYATVSEWTEGICEVILTGYPHLRPILKSRIIGSIYGIFRELGVGETADSRPSMYLPNNIRHLLRNNE